MPFVIRLLAGGVLPYKGSVFSRLCSHHDADQVLYFPIHLIKTLACKLSRHSGPSFVKMVNFKNIAASVAVASIFGSAVAHPGEVQTAEEIKREINSYTAAHVKAGRSLARVANSPAARALRTRAVARRTATAEALREKRGLTKSKWSDSVMNFRRGDCYTNF